MGSPDEYDIGFRIADLFTDLSTAARFRLDARAEYVFSSILEITEASVKAALKAKGYNVEPDADT